MASTVFTVLRSAQSLYTNMAGEQPEAAQDAQDRQELKPIPEPPGLPLIGNLNDLDRSFPLGTFLRLTGQYGGLPSRALTTVSAQLLTALPGEIMRLRLPSTSPVICSSYALVNELCDETRFVKDPQGALAVRGPVTIAQFHVRSNADDEPGIASKKRRTRWTLHSRSRRLRGLMDAEAANIALGQAQ